MTIVTRKPIKIDGSVQKTCMGLQECCGGRGVPDKPAVIKIKKAGTCAYLIEYDLLVEGDMVCIVWDKLMWALCGRYIGDMFESGAQCGEGKIGSLQFEVNSDCWQAVGLKDKPEEDKPECVPPDCECG